MSQFDKIKAGIEKFGKLQFRYATQGASDSEPDGVFQVMLIRALRGKKPTVPDTPGGWELYSDVHGVAAAARSLAAATRNVVELIEQCPIGESARLKAYLEEYCWRVE